MKFSIRSAILSGISLMLGAHAFSATPLDVGAWVQVGNMSANDAGVFNGNCNLALTGCAYGVDTVGDFWNQSPKVFAGQEILFISTDRTVWGVVPYADIYNLKGTDNFAPNLTWRDVGIYGASIGPTVGNVLWRPSTFTAYDTSYDPWLTLRGGHCAHLVSDLYPMQNDCNLLVWGETDFAAPVHASLKNHTGGIQVYVSVGVPQINAKVSGTQGTNGWYVSPVTLGWSVIQAATTSGCGLVGPLSDTTGKTYTCTASNDVGSASVAQLVKQDTVRPSVTIGVPLAGATYKRGAKITVSYSCSDSTSGISACLGPVSNGTKISLATAGVMSFQVTATDRAGNVYTQNVSYTVK